MSDDVCRYEVVTADPEGYWLMQRGSTDPSRWAWMEHENPVEEINRLRARVEELEAELNPDPDAHLMGWEGDDE